MQIVTPPDAGPAKTAESDASAMAIRKALQFVAVLRRRKTIVFAAVAVALLLGLFDYSSSKPVFQATSSLLVQSSGKDAIAATTAFSGISRDLKTYVELFASDVVLLDAAESIDHFPPGINPNNASIDWPSVLRGMISATQRKETSIIDISCRSEDPKAAISVLNAVVDSYVKFVDKNHKNVALEIVRTLDGERESVRKQIESKGQELILAKQHSGDLSVGDSGKASHPLLERVMGLNASLSEIQKKRVTLQAALAGIENEFRSGGDIRQYMVDLEPILGKEFSQSLRGINVEEKTATQRQLFADETELQNLQQHYGRSHSKIRQLEYRIRRSRDYLGLIEAKLEGRTTNSIYREQGELLLDRVAKAVAMAEQQEAAMRQEYLAVEAEAIKLNERLANVQIVQRELERLHNLHETILTRIANIDINQETSNLRASIVRHPKTPKRPVSPQIAKTLPLYVFAGFVIGAGIVFVLDLLDDRFGSPEEISEQLHAPVLAIIRELPPHDGIGADAIHIHAARDEVENEAFRTLRTALTFSAQGRERIAVSSSEPSDGKTTVIANLAASYAQSGRKTLLIDADMRKPGLTKLFDLRRCGGLSEVLRSTESISKVSRERIISSGVDGLDILPCGPKPSNPSELLSGSRLEELIAWAETVYDQVLIDCPPMLVASDAALVGRRTDGVLLVVQPEKNHRRLVLRTAEELRSLQVPLIGVVANRLSDRSGSTYGYGYGYGYGNKYGDEVYGDESESEEIHTDDWQAATPNQRSIQRAA